MTPERMAGLGKGQIQTQITCDDYSVIECPIRATAKIRIMHRGVWLLMVVLIAGCGTSSGGSGPVSLGGSDSAPTVPAASAASPPAPAPASPGSGTPTGGPTLTSPGTVTLADTGATVRLSRGERLNVDLSGDGTWDQPQANGAALQRIAATGGYPSKDPARATFVAAADGTATILSRTDQPCLHSSPPCSVMQRIWLVRVIVSG